MSTDYDPTAEILWSGTDEWVSLAEAVDIVRDGRSIAPEDLKKETISVLDALLRRGLVLVGDLSDGFQAWSLDPSAAIAAIDRRWTAPFEQVSLFEGIWFSNTASGDDLANELADAGLTSRPAPES